MCANLYYWNAKFLVASTVAIRSGWKLLHLITEMEQMVLLSNATFSELMVHICVSRRPLDVMRNVTYLTH